MKSIRIQTFTCSTFKLVFFSSDPHAEGVLIAVLPHNIPATTTAASADLRETCDVVSSIPSLPAGLYDHDMVRSYTKIWEKFILSHLIAAPPTISSWRIIPSWVKFLSTVDFLEILERRGHMRQYSKAPISPLLMATCWADGVEMIKDINTNSKVICMGAMGQDGTCQNQGTERFALE